MIPPPRGIRGAAHLSTGPGGRSPSSGPTRPLGGTNRRRGRIRRRRRRVARDRGWGPGSAGPLGRTRSGPRRAARQHQCQPDRAPPPPATTTPAADSPPQARPPASGPAVAAATYLRSREGTTGEVVQGLLDLARLGGLDDQRLGGQRRSSRGAATTLRAGRRPPQPSPRPGPGVGAPPARVGRGRGHRPPRRVTSPAGDRSPRGRRRTRPRPPPGGQVTALRVRYAGARCFSASSTATRPSTA